MSLSKRKLTGTFPTHHRTDRGFTVRCHTPCQTLLSGPRYNELPRGPPLFSLLCFHSPSQTDILLSLVVFSSLLSWMFCFPVLLVTLPCLWFNINRSRYCKLWMNKRQGERKRRTFPLPPDNKIKDEVCGERRWRGFRSRFKRFRLWTEG